MKPSFRAFIGIVFLGISVFFFVLAVQLYFVC